MGSTFNPQILMEKLAKLNNSQQSIETLSHWCIFHMHKAKQVVETWDRQFHASPPEQRLAFLYLANDILQNSRRKGSEFVGEFWRFLPDALRDVIKNGDEFAKNAALRLISIWEERKVFGSRGQILKEEIIGRNIENNNNSDINGKSLGGLKLKNSAGNALEKIVSGYQIIYGQLDEDSLLTKCRNAVSYVEKVDKDISGDINSGQFNVSAMVEELKGQDDKLRECIEQMASLESSRANLISNLREALQEQELKLDEVRNQLQTAKSRSEQAGNILVQLSPQDQTTTGNNSIKELPAHHYAIQQISSSSAEEDPKSAAAAIAAKLTASTSSVETLSYVLSSLVSEGIIGSSTKLSSSTEYHPDVKRVKLDTEMPPPIPQNEQPPPPSSPPPQQPLPPPQFANVGLPYGYGTTQQLSPLQPPSKNYQNAYKSEGGFYSQPSATISRQ